MDDLMIMATGLMSKETRRIDVAAQNIANAATPGYKRELAFDQVMGKLAQIDPVAGSATGVATDFTPGKLQHTGNPTDLAIQGAGFFEVATPTGSAYTRAGAFHRDAQGYLVTTQGWRLQSADGGDVRVSENDWQVESDGSVIDHGVSTMKVRVVDVDDDKHLVRGSDGFFTSADVTPADVDDARLSQGFLEASNTVVGSDMVQIMEAMRRMESGQKIVHAYDDMIGGVLQRLGDM